MPEVEYTSKSCQGRSYHTDLKNGMPEAEYTLGSCWWHIYHSALGSGLYNAWSRVYFKIMSVAHTLCQGRIYHSDLKNRMPEAEYTSRSCWWHIYYSALSRVYNVIMSMAHILLSLKLWIIWSLKQSILQDHVSGTYNTLLWAVVYIMPKAEKTSRSCQRYINYSALSCWLYNAWSRVYFKIMSGAHILLSLKLWII